MVDSNNINVMRENIRKNANNIRHTLTLPEGGNVGDFLVSDGDKGVEWKTLTNADEVEY